MKNKNFHPFNWDSSHNASVLTEEGATLKQKAALDIFCAMVSCSSFADTYRFDELRKLAIEQADLLVNEIPEK